MKRIVFIIAVLGFGLVCLQKQSYANKKESHSEYAKMEIRECNSCHKGEGVALNHDADFVRGHRVLASKAGSNCSQCHDQSWCLDCHQGGGIGNDISQSQSGRDYKPKSHRSDFISIHPMQAQNNQQQCYRCHDQKYCTACHSRFPKGSLKIKSHLMSGTGQTYLLSSEHASEARRNLQSCQACHPEGDECLRCHSAKTGARINPHPQSFKGNNYKNRSDRTCVKCHYFR